MGSIKDKTAIVGMGVSRFGEHWDKGRADMIIDAVYEALEDAGMELKDIEAGVVGTHLGGLTSACLAEALQWDNVPITRVENNCTSGSDAFRVACLSVASGMYDTVLAVGFEKSKDSGAGALTWPSGIGTHPVSSFPSGPAGFAMAAVRYFHKYGLSPEIGKRTLAKIAVKNHHNGTMSPKAHFRREVTMEAVMNAPMIAWPLGLFDCCPTTDGAAAAIITRADLAKNFRDDYVLVKGLGLAIGREDDYRNVVKGKISDYTYWVETDAAAHQAYQQAGITQPRQEIDIIECHDCFTITELINCESLLVWAKGTGQSEIDAGTFTISGDLPVNTDGGLKAFGHPLGASGIRMVCEVYKQLQGKAGPRQLANPRIGLTHCQGGNPTGGFQTSVQVLGARD